MNIDIAKKDLFHLRRNLHERRSYLRMTAAAKRAETEYLVKPDIELLTRTIRKVNLALKKAYGHDCCAEAFV